MKYSSASNRSTSAVNHLVDMSHSVNRHRVTCRMSFMLLSKSSDRIIQTNRKKTDREHLDQNLIKIGPLVMTFLYTDRRRGTRIKITHFPTELNFKFHLKSY
jgi:hypothetical protein